MTDDPFDYARESLTVNALIFQGKPRLAWQRHRELGDTLAEWIERQRRRKRGLIKRLDRRR